MSEDIDNKEQQESIDDLLKRVQILKIEAELKDSKRNYFQKYIYPELPKWVPALFLGFITIWITTSKDILGTKEDKLSIREDKVGISEKKLEIEMLQDNIKKLTTIQDKKAESVTQLDNEYLEKLNEIKNLNTRIASIQVLYEEERSKALGLERQQNELQNQNKTLAKESSDIKLSSLTESVYHNPYINNKYVYEAIDIIKGQTEMGTLLTKEFESNIKKNYHKAINYFILYSSTKDKKYFTSILDGVRQMCFNQVGAFDNPNMYELLNILESRNFTKDEHAEISRMILDNIIYNPEIKGPLIQFITLPGFYLHSIYNLDRTFLKPEYWISYIALNNRILKTKNPFDAAVTDDTTFLNSQYKYNSILSDKRSILYNLYKTFPQVAFAYYIAMMSKGNWNNLQGIQSEALILGQYIMNLSTNEYSTCQTLFREFINTDIFNDVSNKTDISVLFAKLNSLISEINAYQSKNKDQLNKWNDIEMGYFNSHIDEFSLKTKECDL